MIQAHITAYTHSLRCNCDTIQINILQYISVTFFIFYFSQYMSVSCSIAEDNRCFRHPYQAINVLTMSLANIFIYTRAFIYIYISIYIRRYIIYIHINVLLRYVYISLWMCQKQPWPGSTNIVSCRLRSGKEVQILGWNITFA